MSKSPFIESESSDPFVQQLCRSAVRVLNDKSLTRVEREAQIRRLQALWREHHQAQLRRASALVRAAARRPQRDERNTKWADPKTVALRRRELGMAAPAPQAPGVQRPRDAGVPAVPQVAQARTSSRPLLRLRSRT